MLFVKTLVILALLVVSSNAQLIAADVRNNYYLPNPASLEALKPFLVSDSSKIGIKEVAKDKMSQRPVLYGETDENVLSAEGSNVKILMTDALGVDRDISIFAGLVRQVESLMYRLQDRDAETMVLAPSNHAMQNLPRKPWESADQSESGDPMEDERRAMANIEKFVLSHVVYGQGLEKPGEKKKCGAGISDIWYNEDHGEKVVVSSKKHADVSALVVKSQDTGNGIVWTIDGALIE
ncbi:hypothetical protein V1511DRAFT_45433 [Dipodascopsis uninucleata]